LVCFQHPDVRKEWYYQILQPNFNQPIIRHNQQHINRNRKISYWQYQLFRDLTGFTISPPAFGVFLPSKILSPSFWGFYHLTKTSHLFLTSRRRSKKISRSLFRLCRLSKSPLSRFGVSSASTIVYLPFGISSTFTTVSLPFWDFVDFHNCLSPLLGSRRLSQLSLSPFGVSPGSPNCYNLKGEESQIRNSHNKQKIRFLTIFKRCIVTNNQKKRKPDEQCEDITIVEMSYESMLILSIWVQTWSKLYNNQQLTNLPKYSSNTPHVEPTESREITKHETKKPQTRLQSNKTSK